MDSGVAHNPDMSDSDTRNRRINQMAIPSHIEEKGEEKVRTLNALDCCHDPKCAACRGRGYITPTKEAIEKQEEEP